MNTTSLPPERARLRLPADPDATERLGERIGRQLRTGTVLALVGDLGTGKTTLVRGLARGLKVDDPDAVASPTYLLVVEHEGPLPLRHADAYLPAKLAGFLADGGLDYLLAPDAVCAVEWADRIADQLPAAALWVVLTVTPDGGRSLAFRCAAPGDFPWLGHVAETHPGTRAEDPAAPPATAGPDPGPDRR
ncbi:MAG: tRNA (adenosine(37)-N6)-threonylcarbamoyltransferase complex ATPase subunit type 1 TsaE [Planctomycetota bacterium]